MNLSIRKNKLLFINTFLLFLTFIVFLVFFLTPRIDCSDDGILSSGQLLFLSIYRAGGESIGEWIYIGIIPTILLIISIIYIIHCIVLIAKKDKEIKYSKLLFYQIAYLFMIVIFLILDTTIYKKDMVSFLSFYLLIPILVFSIYHLVSIMLLYKKVSTQNIKNNDNGGVK